MKKFIPFVLVLAGCAPPDENVGEVAQKEIIGANRLYRVGCLSPTSREFDMSQSVGRLFHSVQLPGQVPPNIGATCTGFLINHSNHFVTANHCVPIDTAANASQVWFNYQYTNCTGTAEPNRGTYHATFVARNVNADLAVLQLTPDAGMPDAAATYGVIRANSTATTPGTNYLNVFIPQHPHGQMKQYTASSVDGVCYAQTQAVNFPMKHYCDTLPGSSGAPILSSNGAGGWFLIGIHLRRDANAGSALWNEGIAMATAFNFLLPWSSLP